MNTTKFKSKYLIPSTRLRNWDYAGEGMYFVTICTKNRQGYFGNIEKDKMQLSPMGEIVQKCWMEIPVHFPFVTLDEFIVMPNHIHGIIIINKNAIVETPHWGVSTSVSTTQPNSHHIENKIGGFNPNWKPNSLGSIINQFKSICTKQIRKLYKPNFAWQPRFYDHVIRKENSCAHIRQYILENPLKWDMDNNNPLRDSVI